MNTDRDYYYIQYEKNKTSLKDVHKNKINKIINNEIYQNFTNNSQYIYLILNKTDIIGFFSLNLKEKHIEVTSLYILKKYRNKGIATDIINDIIFAVKYNMNYNINLIIVNSYVETAVFFLKKGFDFCKINKKLDYKKKNIILLYKTF